MIGGRDHLWCEHLENQVTEIMTPEELFETMSHHRPPTAAKEWRSRADFFIDRIIAYPDSPLAAAVWDIFDESVQAKLTQSAMDWPSNVGLATIQVRNASRFNLIFAPGIWEKRRSEFPAVEVLGLKV